jgi:enoyl-CoA hydratase/carnithine racemase
MPAELLADRRDATLVLTLSNPGLRNVMHADVFAAAIETLSTAERDDSLRAVVVTGADDFFSAGDNLHGVPDNRAREQAAQADTIDQLHAWVEAIRDCPKPVIAAVEGGAAGAGFSLALACDLMVAGVSAKFLMDYVKAGLTPDAGASWFLARALPRQLAAEMLIEGKPVDAQRLHELGIVNKLVPDGTALDAALSWAEDLARLSPHAVERIKALLREAESNSLSRQLEAEKLNLVQSLHHRGI